MDKLYIGSDLLDCDELEYPVDLAIFDAESFETKKANKSKIIRVPATENNQQILGRLHDVAINPTLTGLEGRLVKNGFELKGRVIIHDIERDKDGIHYNLQIVSGNGDWVKQLEGKMITELDIPTIEHEYNDTNINDSETAGGDYVYPLINYGQFQGGDTGAEVIDEDRIPAVKVWAVMQKIYNTIGYKVSSTFCNLAAFSKWFMTPRDPDQYTQEFCDDKLFRASGTESVSQVIPNDGNPTTLLLFSGANNETFPFDDDSTDPNFDAAEAVAVEGNFNPSTYKFTASADMWCRFKVSLDCLFQFSEDFDDVTGTFKVDIMHEGVSVASDTDSGFSFTPGEFKYECILKADSKFIYLSDGDEVLIKITVTGTATNSGPGSEGVVFAVRDSDDTWFKNQMIRRPGRGYDWTTETLLPDITQMDFLKWVFHIFHFQVATNPRERTVYIEPFGDFFDQAPVNWSGKLDLSRGVVIKGKDIPSYINYRMRIDGNDSQIINYFTEVKLSNGNGDTKENANELFADTMLDYCREIGLNTTQIPKLWNKKEAYPEVPEQSMNFATRLLYYDGQTALPSGETWTFEGAVKTTYPKFSVYNFATFITYRNTLHRIMNNAQRLTVYVRLSAVDVNNLSGAITGKDFRSKVYLDDSFYKGRYIISSIDGYRDDQTQQVELIQSRQLATGISTRQVQITGEGATGGGGGGSTATSGTTTGCSHLITDATAISNITDSANWSAAGNYTGSLAGMAEGDYYVDWTNKIQYIYDGTHLVRFNINAIF